MIVIVRVRDKKGKLRQGKLAFETGPKETLSTPRCGCGQQGGRNGWLLEVGQECRIVGLLSCRDEREKTIVRSGGNRRQLAAWPVFIAVSPQRTQQGFVPCPEGGSAVIARSEQSA